MVKLTRVLLIGINYTGTQSELHGCINDIIAIKEYFKVSLGVTEATTEFRILSEANHDRQFHPTKANILEGFKWLIEGATATSRLFFHYSGHGSSIRDVSGDEIADKRDETICPLDYNTAGLITDDELRALIVNKLPTGAKLWAIMDCCHSGTGCDLRFNYKINLLDDRKEYTINAQNQYPKSNAQVILLSGCMDNQTSADAWIRSENKFMGALTYSFIESVKEMKATRKPITYKRLMKYLQRKVKAGGYTQIPQLSSGQFLDLSQNVEIA